MNRQQKESAVSSVRDLFDQSEAAFLVNYQGTTVSSLESLRKELRDNDGTLKVTKARLMKIAAKDIDGIDGFKDTFKEQVGLVFAKSDVPAIAKVLSNFSKDAESFEIVSGFFEQNILTQEQIKMLASLPSREVLLGQVAATLQAPISTYARLLQMMIIRLLFVLKKVAEKNEG